MDESIDSDCLNDDADPSCYYTGIHKIPYPLCDDVKITNCIFCGKEFHRIGREWKTWDWNLFQKPRHGTDE